MRYSTPGINRKRNIYWFYILFFMKRMNPFIEGSEKNGSGPPAGKTSKNLCFIDKNDMFVIESINFCQFGN